MKLTVFNGSPKPGPNNTQLLIDHLIKGMRTISTAEVEVYKLNKLPAGTKAAEIFAEAETVLIAFPLYAFAMPGDVKQFFETLEPYKGKCKGKKLGFLVQYGFIEGIHARPLERHLVKLAAMLGCTYIGTIIKGGCDSLSQTSESKFKSFYEGMQAIGKTLAERHTFDENQLKAYAQPETSRKYGQWFMKILVKFINYFYWGRMLKKNGVSIKESFAKPYE